MTVDQFFETAKMSMGAIGFGDRFLSSGFFFLIQFIAALLLIGIGMGILGGIGLRGGSLLLGFAVVIVFAVAISLRAYTYYLGGSPLVRRGYDMRLCRFLRLVLPGDLPVDRKKGHLYVTMPEGGDLAVSYSRNLVIGLPRIMLGGPVGISQQPAGTVHPRTFFVVVNGETLNGCQGDYTFDFSGRDDSDQYGLGVRLIDRQRQEISCTTEECRLFKDRLAAVVKKFPIKGEVHFQGRKFRLQIYDPLASGSFNDTEPEVRLPRKVRNLWKQKGWEVVDISFAGVRELLESIVGSQGSVSQKDTSTRMPSR